MLHCFYYLQGTRRVCLFVFIKLEATEAHLMQAQRWECFHFASWKAKDKLGPAMRKLDDGKAKYRAVLFKFP